MGDEYDEQEKTQYKAHRIAIRETIDSYQEKIQGMEKEKKELERDRSKTLNTLKRTAESFLYEDISKKDKIAKLMFLNIHTNGREVAGLRPDTIR